MIRSVVVAAVLLGSLAGCERAQGHVAIDVDQPAALVDEAIRVRVSGLGAGETAVVSAESRAADDRRWRSEATFRVGPDGTLDLNRDAATSGSYRGVDGMGLFSFMDPVGAEGDESYYVVSAQTGVEEVRLAVALDGAEVAHTTVRRVLRSANVTVRELTAERDKMVGLLFLPPADARKRTGVLLLGGSDGRLGLPGEAGLLASQGFPTLSLAFFHQPGLPADLRDIPLEYFAAGARRLAADAGVDTPVAIIGYSRGTEAALLSAQYYPDLFRGVVLYAPSERVNLAFPGNGTAWVHSGRPVPGRAIPTDHVAGPVLAIAGTDDLVWPSARGANAIMGALDRARSAAPHQALVYAGSGHFVGTYPYLPIGVIAVHPVTGQRIDGGGTRQGDEAARRDGWPKVLAMLTSLG
jgi:dienelactone hydrolase